MKFEDAFVSICLLKIILLSLIFTGKVHSDELGVLEPKVETIYAKCTENDTVVPTLCIGIKSNVTTFAGGMAEYKLDDEACIAKASCDVLIQAIRTEEELLTWLIYAKTNDTLYNAIRFSLFNQNTRLNKPLKIGDIILEVEDDADHKVQSLNCGVKKIIHDKKLNKTQWMSMETEAEQNITFKPTMKFEYVTDNSSATNYTLCVFQSSHILNEGDEDPVDLNSQLNFYLDHLQRTFNASEIEEESEGFSDWTRQNYVRNSDEFLIWKRKMKFTVKKGKTNGQLTSQVTTRNQTMERTTSVVANSTTNSVTLNDASVSTFTSLVEYENESLESNQGKGKSVNGTIEPVPVDEINDPNVLTVNNGNNEGRVVNLNTSNSSQSSSSPSPSSLSNSQMGSSLKGPTNEVTNEVEKFTSDPITENSTVSRDSMNFSSTSEVPVIGRNATPFDENSFNEGGDGEEVKTAASSSSDPSDTRGTRSTMQWIFGVAAMAVVITVVAMVSVCISSNRRNRRTISIAYSSGNLEPSASSLTTSLSTIN